MEHGGGPQRFTLDCSFEQFLLIDKLQWRGNYVQYVTTHACESESSCIKHNMYSGVCGLPTFRYALAHHKPEPVTAFPPEK